MGKEAAFVHLKKKPMKKRKKNQLVNKVLDYLKSDTFMFAPFYSSSVESSSSSSFSFSVPDGIEEDKPSDKKLVSIIGDYLKADDYLYAPLLSSPPRGSAETVHLSKGPVPVQEEMGRKRSADVLKGGTGKADEPGRKIVNVVSKDHNMDGFPHTRSPMVTRTRVRRETVKHMIYQNC